MGGRCLRQTRGLGRAVLFLTGCPCTGCRLRTLRLPRTTPCLAMAGDHVRLSVHDHDRSDGAPDRSFGSRGIHHDGGTCHAERASCLRRRSRTQGLEQALSSTRMKTMFWIRRCPKATREGEKGRLSVVACSAVARRRQRRAALRKCLPFSPSLVALRWLSREFARQTRAVGSTRCANPAAVSASRS